MSERRKVSVNMTAEQVDELRKRFRHNWPTSEDGNQLLAAYDRVSANAAGLQTDLTAAKNRADRLQSDLDRVTRERDEAIEARESADFETNQRMNDLRHATVRLRSQRENANFEARKAKEALERVRALAVEVEHRMMATATPAEIRAALEGTSGTPEEPAEKLLRDIFTEPAERVRPEDLKAAEAAGSMRAWDETDVELESGVSGGTVQPEPQGEWHDFDCGPNHGGGYPHFHTTAGLDDSLAGRGSDLAALGSSQGSEPSMWPARGSDRPVHRAQLLQDDPSGRESSPGPDGESNGKVAAQDDAQTEDER